MIGHLLNRPLDVYRQARRPDGSGGHVITWLLVSRGVPARVAQPTTEERVAALQAGARWDSKVYVQADADVRRGDELRDPATGEAFRVDSTVQPSTSSVYRRADCERVQVQGEA